VLGYITPLPPPTAVVSPVNVELDPLDPLALVEGADPPPPTTAV
jgi:hypothetical protein